MQQRTSFWRWSGLAGCSLGLVAAMVLGLAGCENNQGIQGPPGEAGPPGSSCTVADNGDGTKTLSCEDGTSVTVANGLVGGSCTVADNGDGTKTITCTDGTTVTVSDGTNGNNGIATIDGTIIVQVIDAETLAYVPYAEVVTDVDVVPVTADAGGRVTLASLPAGLYKITVSAPGLGLSGSALVEEMTQSASTDWKSVVAGATLNVEIFLQRFVRDEMPLDALHDGLSAYFVATNCQACHSSRTEERTTDGFRKPFHAMATHSSLGCTACHWTVDLANQSGADLRKQVDVTSTCAGCHFSYPASF